MDVNFDLQQHLGEMESRIRADIQAQANTMLRAQTDINNLREDVTRQDGRVKSLEEKAGWLGAGLTSGIVALTGMAWHMVTGGGK